MSRPRLGMLLAASLLLAHGAAAAGFGSSGCAFNWAPYLT